MFCVPLTWQEQENLGRKAHLAALPEALPFLCLSRLLSWIVIIIYLLVLTGQYAGSHNSMIYKSTQ
jgi:hypothetical protein